MADSCHFRTMHRGAAETPHLAQDNVVLDTSSDTHAPPTALPAVPDTAATEDQRSLPGPLGQQHFSSASNPPLFLSGPKVESLQYAAHLPDTALYNYLSAGQGNDWSPRARPQ